MSKFFGKVLQTLLATMAGYEYAKNTEQEVIVKVEQEREHPIERSAESENILVIVIIVLSFLIILLGIALVICAKLKSRRNTKLTV